MKSKIFLGAIIVALTLTACGSDETDDGTIKNPSEASKSNYETNEFKISYPSDWEVIDSTNYTSNVPPQIMVAFRSNIKNEVFTANLNISKNDLNEDISSMDFAKSSMAKAKSTLVSFEEISNENYSVELNGEPVETLITEFQGKKIASDPTVRFKRLSLVKGNQAFTVSGAYLPSEDEGVINAIDEMLRSFVLK